MISDVLGPETTINYSALVHSLLYSISNMTQDDQELQLSKLSEKHQLAIHLYKTNNACGATQHPAFVRDVFDGFIEEVSPRYTIGQYLPMIFKEAGKDVHIL